MDLSLMAAFWPAKHVSGAVIRKDGSILATMGDVDRIFPLASVTKLITTYVALIAIEEGAIDLDTPVDPGGTIKHLLSHTSGYDFDASKIWAAPGERRIYSNIGMEKLAESITLHTGIMFEEYAKEALLQPLGLKNTSYLGSPAAQVSSNLEDMIFFCQELQNPQLLSPVTLEKATTVVFPQAAGILPGFGKMTPNPWGLGFEIRGNKSPHWTGVLNSSRTYGHFGQSGTFLWVDPVADLGCVVLTDEPFGEWAKDSWPKFSDKVLERFS